MNDWRTWLAIAFAVAVVLGAAVVFYYCAAACFGWFSRLFERILSLRRVDTAISAARETKHGQGRVAIALLVLGVLGVAYTWYELEPCTGMRLATGVMFPFCAVTGLGFLIAPFDPEAYRWRYGAYQPEGWSELPRGTKVICTLALAASVANVLALRAAVRG